MAIERLQNQILFRLKAAAARHNHLRRAGILALVVVFTLIVAGPDVRLCNADQLNELQPSASPAEKQIGSKPADARYLTAKAFEIEGLPLQRYNFKVDYKNAVLQRINLAGTVGYVIKPTGRVDAKRRWVWIVPLWLALPSAHGDSIARYDVEESLAAGFHVVGFDVGASLGSPKGAESFRRFHDHIVQTHHLTRKARMLAVSNGGLITYGYAFRHLKRVDRIFGCIELIDLAERADLRRELDDTRHWVSSRDRAKEKNGATRKIIFARQF